MHHVHDAAQRGFSDQASAYARGRPDYPAALGSWLSGVLGLGRDQSAVDLGAGTGKFTGLLLRTGAQVTAVEPVDAMREQLSAGLSKDWPHLRALAGTAQAMPLVDAQADAVLCAQAFHWFANDAALAEIHRVLKPGGRLGLVWNVRDESLDWVAAITAIVTPYEGDTPRFYKGDWRRPFQTTALFGPLQESSFGYAHVGSAQEVIIDRFMSVSFIAALGTADQATVRAQLQDLVTAHPALKGQERVVLPYQTRAFHCTRV